MKYDKGVYMMGPYPYQPRQQYEVVVPPVSTGEPTHSTLCNPLKIFVMKKVTKLTLALLGLYALAWSVIWVVAVAAGAPANLGEWNTFPRALIALFGAPLVAAILADMADKYMEKHR